MSEVIRLQPKPCGVCGEATDPMHFDGPCAAYLDLACLVGNAARLWLCSVECAWLAGGRVARVFDGTPISVRHLQAEFVQGSVEELQP